MPFPKGKKNPGAGRPKGAVNKATAEVKSVILEVAAGMGNAKGMLAWIKKDPKNEAAFWTNIYPRIAPLDVKHGGEITSRVLQVELPKKTNADAMKVSKNPA